MNLRIFTSTIIEKTALRLFMSLITQSAFEISNGSLKLENRCSPSVISFVMEELQTLGLGVLAQ